MDRLKNIQSILRNDNRVAKTRISRAKVKSGYTYFYERRLWVWFKDSDLLADKSLKNNGLMKIEQTSK